MDKNHLQELAKDFLQPLIPSAVIEANEVPSTTSDKLAARF
jgi:hypothetical protein